jgi:dihydroorotase
MSLLIQNARMPDGSKVDCLIERDRITQLQESITADAQTRIDARGKTLLPGMIDAHVHFRVPGNPEKEDFTTGGAAAIAGGVTTVLAMPNTNPPITSAIQVATQHEQMDRQLPIFGMTYIGATTDNLDQILQAEKEVCGVKVYYGTTTGSLTMNDDAALEALLASDFQKPIVIHAEDDDIIEEYSQQLKGYDGADIHSRIRDRSAAIQALETVLALVKKTGATNVHITHMTTAQELDMIAQAKKDGVNITCDVTPHHLAFTTEDYHTQGHLLRVNPPIRTQEDVDALWKGVKDGTIDMIASDHAPHLLSEKNGEYAEVASGVPGVETSLPFLLDRIGKGFSLERVVELVAAHPAQRFGLTDRGVIEEGAFADVILVDKKGKTKITNDTVKSKAAWSPWDGTVFQWSIDTVISRGKIVSS